MERTRGALMDNLASSDSGGPEASLMADGASRLSEAVSKLLDSFGLRAAIPTIAQMILKISWEIHGIYHVEEIT